MDVDWSVVAVVIAGLGGLGGAASFIKTFYTGRAARTNMYTEAGLRAIEGFGDLVEAQKGEIAVLRDRISTLNERLDKSDARLDRHAAELEQCAREREELHQETRRLKIEHDSEMRSLLRKLAEAGATLSSHDEDLEARPGEAGG